MNCIVKNFYLIGGMGDIPQAECLPELWILDDAKYPEAKMLIEETQPLPESGKSWICVGCGEPIEPQFTQCWKCGKNRPIP